MPFIDNNDIKIHYHVEGAGPTLIMQHGLTGSLANWYDYGFVTELQKFNQLILIDARGHGHSSKPHDPQQYDLKLRVGDITSVMDHLGIEKANYLGYSMGGRIGFGLILHALERFESFIIGGMGAHVANTDVPPQDRIAALENGMANYVSGIEAKEGKMEQLRKDRLLENDPQALIAATIAPMGTEDVEQALPNLDTPCLIYCGDADGFFPSAKASAGLIPNCEFITLPGLDHGQASRASEESLPFILKFLKQMTSAKV